MVTGSRNLFKTYDDDAVSLVRRDTDSGTIWDIVIGGTNTNLGIDQAVIDSLKKTKAGQLYPVEHHINVTINSLIVEFRRRNINFTDEAKKRLTKLLSTLV